VLSYRVALDVPFQLAVFVSRLLADHRRELGTRAGTRALTCWKRAGLRAGMVPGPPETTRQYSLPTEEDKANTLNLLTTDH
jgi:hypothetical protein